ncbi:MAG: S41 family peptidase [Acetobacter sp.]|jgi:carboxyl-terminal processing protease
MKCYELLRIGNREVVMWMLRFLIVPIVLFGGVASARADTPCPLSSAATALPAPSLDQKIWIATRVYDTVERYFAHWEALPPDYDFDAHYKVFVNQAVAAKTRIAFDLSVMKLFGSLANGHTNFFDAELMCHNTLPFRAQPSQDGWVIVRSHHPDLVPGDVITAIDGQNFSRWVDLHIPYVRGSNAVASQNRLFARALVWPVRFKLTLGDGKKVTVDRDVPYTGPSRGLPPPPTETQTTVTREGIARIAIPSFGEARYEDAAVAAVKAHANAPAILFDLRGNNGGSTPMALIRTVLEKPMPDMLSTTPLHIGVLKAWSQSGDQILPNAMVRDGGEIIQPDHPVFHGRVFVLTDRHCVSACEDFVLAMRVSHRATILGETTEGSTGQPYSVDFPALNMTFRVSTRREYYPDGSPFEGIGVRPDIEIPVTRAMLASREDAVLEQVLSLIRQSKH